MLDNKYEQEMATAMKQLLKLLEDPQVGIEERLHAAHVMSNINNNQLHAYVMQYVGSDMANASKDSNETNRLALSEARKLREDVKNIDRKPWEDED